MDKSTILTGLLAVPILAASGCREKCQSYELRYGDKCILKPDSGIVADEEDASQEESVETIDSDENDTGSAEVVEGDDSDLDGDASTVESAGDARDPDRDAGNASCTDAAGSVSCTCDAPYEWNGQTCVCPTGYSSANCAECAAGYLQDDAGTCRQVAGVTITFIGDGYGRVTFSNGVPDCTESCMRSVPEGTSLTLQAIPRDYSKFVSWSGASCPGGNCTIITSAHSSLTVRFQLAYNVAFVTSTATAPGAIGGLLAADAECARLAAASGLHSTRWVAYLSTEAPCPGATSGSCYAPDRLSGARGWVNRLGQPIADTPEELRNYRWRYPVYHGENGEAIRDYRVATGSQYGSVATGRTCGDYSSVGMNAWGFSRSVDKSAEYLGDDENCNRPQHWRCFSIDENRAMSITRGGMGRLAFVTTSGWSPAGGIAAADELCQREACQAKLTGSADCGVSLGVANTFRAWLATESAYGSARFTSSALDYYRSDGILWLTAKELAVHDDTTLVPETALNMAADGSFVSTPGFDAAWTGTPMRNCNNWQSAGADAPATYGSLGHVDRFQFQSGNVNCQGELHLRCLQL